MKYDANKGDMKLSAIFKNTLKYTYLRTDCLSLQIWKYPEREEILAALMVILQTVFPFFLQKKRQSKH